MYLDEIAGQGLSPATQYAYDYWLLGERMVAARAALGLGDELLLNRELVSAIQNRLRRDGRAPGTVMQATRSIRTFARYCVERGWLEDREATALRMRNPRVPLALPDPFTDAQLAALRKAAHWPRDRLVLDVLLGTGLRLSEAGRLTIDDLLERPGGWHVVRVRKGKGSKDRYTPLGLPSEPLWPRVEHYVNEIRPAPPDGSQRHLFLCQGGRWHDGGGVGMPLTGTGIYRICQTLRYETGIQVNPHRFRHTWATRAIAAGIHTEAVRVAGGWSDLQVMRRYLHIGIGDVLDAWGRAAGPQP